MSEEITRLLDEAHAGDNGALDRLMEAVYADLQRMAERHLRERFGQGLPGVTLEPAALVNESFLKIIKQRQRYDNRGHFFAIATKIMLRVLVDYQRSRAAVKRGGRAQRITISILEPGADPSPAAESAVEVEGLVAALDRLEQLDARKADVVRLRVIWGLEMREIATSLGVSLATVERDWSFSKAWLARELTDARSEEGPDPYTPAP